METALHIISNNGVVESNEWDVGNEGKERAKVNSYTFDKTEISNKTNSKASSPGTRLDLVSVGYSQMKNIHRFIS